MVNNKNKSTENITRFEKNVAVVLKRVIKINLSGIILLVIIIVAVFLRLQYLDYPLSNGEAQNHYIAGRHVLDYKEFPLTGALNALDKMRTSPVYYYVIALILLINKNLLFLQAVNITLQVLTIFFVYFLGSRLFSIRTGLISAFLYSISVVVFEQSRFFWQPHVMVFLVHLSMVLLLKAYQSYNRRFIYFSTFFLFLGFTIHNSAYLLLPPYIFLALFIFKNSLVNRKIYLTSLLIGLISSLMFYLPSYFYLSYYQTGVTPPTDRFLNLSFTVEAVRFIARINNNFQLFLDSFFSGKYTHLSLIVPLGIIVYTFYQKRESSWWRYMILLLIIFQVLLLSSLFDKKMFMHYYMSIFGLFIIVISETLVFIFRPRRSGFLPQAISYSILIIVTVAIATIFSRNYINIIDKKPLYNKSRISEASNAIIKEAKTIQMNENRDQLNFFTISVYNKYKNHPMNAMPFWMHLENELNLQFIHLNKKLSNYYTINRSDYIFIVCQQYNALPKHRITENCLRYYFSYFPKYNYQKKLFTNSVFEVHLFKRYGS